MEMNEGMLERPPSVPALPVVSPQPPPAHLSNGTASTSSFMMSPLSEPRMTPTFAPTTYPAHQHHSHLHHQPPLLSLASSWPGSNGDSLQLLATAAHMRSSSEEERSSSPEPSPVPITEVSGMSLFGHQTWLQLQFEKIILWNCVSN